MNCVVWRTFIFPQCDNAHEFCTSKILENLQDDFDGLFQVFIFFINSNKVILKKIKGLDLEILFAWMFLNLKMFS